MKIKGESMNNKTQLAIAPRTLHTWALAALLALAVVPESRANGPAPTRSQANFEVRFMTMMIDHHAMAVGMAMICTNKAVHAELHQLCENIIATQSAEIDEMQSWLQQWYGLTHEPEMKPGDEKMMQRLASMSGADFEIMFLEMMIRHHHKAVVRARECEKKAYHPELIALCNNIETSQTAEIQEMQSWLCQWYGICRNGPQ